MITRNNITEVAYNTQTTVDSDHNIPIDYKVTNTNDSKAMGNMLQRTKSILHTNEFTCLYDKGYHTGSEFQIAHNLDIDTIVAIPSTASQAPNPSYNVAHFDYDKTIDCYTCPEGHKLTTTGKLHKAKTYLFKRYTTRACLSCVVKEECSKAKYGKAIQRSEYQELIELNKQRVKQNETYYKRRQSIVEHPYGTLKRQWGFNYIITKKGLERASADIGFMMIAYNLRRLINIIGLQSFREYLEEVLLILNKIRYIGLITANIKALKFQQKKCADFIKLCLKPVYLNQILMINISF